MPEYKDPLAEHAAELNKEAAHAFDLGVETRVTAERYVRITVVLAAVLFLIAIGQRFQIRGVRYAVNIVAVFSSSTACTCSPCIRTSSAGVTGGGTRAGPMPRRPRRRRRRRDPRQAPAASLASMSANCACTHFSTLFSSTMRRSTAAREARSSAGITSAL